MAVPNQRWPQRILQGLVVIGLLWGVHLYQTRHAATGPAPPLAGLGLHGESLSLDGLRGSPVLVHFWASWCPVCRLEQSSIDAIAKDYPVLTVALDESSASEMLQFLHEQQVDYPVIIDQEGDMAAAFGVRGVPSSFIVDADGNIDFISVGYTTEAGLRLRLWLAGLDGGAF